jgi:D-3-phosphoglycerate dehydrogenase
MSERKQVVAIDGGCGSIGGHCCRVRILSCAVPAARRSRCAAHATRILIVESPVTRHVLEGAPRCRAVIPWHRHRCSTRPRRGRRVAVGGVPDYGTDEVATQTVALALAVVRRLRLHDREVRAGRWSTGVLKPMHRLRGATLGLVGYGRIARMTQAMFAGFGIARVMVLISAEAALEAAVDVFARRPT